MCLHAVGANHGYSSVDFGFWLSKTFGFVRPNVYDRFVHLLFGVLFAYPVHEILKRYSSFRTIWIYILPVDFILSYSAFYELMEAATAWTMPPEDYDPFVGLQGDIWDGFRDMALAFGGSIITMTMLGIVSALSRKHRT
jgi:putative membrane protein